MRRERAVPFEMPFEIPFEIPFGFLVGGTLRKSNRRSGLDCRNECSVPSARLHGHGVRECCTIC